MSVSENRSLYDALAIANHFLRLAKDDGRKLTPMQLLKLVYISHGWHLAIHDYGLISDFIQAWRYGPVIERLYYAIKHYRNTPVTKLLDTNGDFVLQAREYDIPEKDEFLRAIFNRYKELDGWELSALTHKEGTPWDTTVKSSGMNSPIKDDVIKEYYNNLYVELRNQNNIDQKAS